MSMFSLDMQFPNNFCYCLWVFFNTYSKQTTFRWSGTCSWACDVHVIKILKNLIRMLVRIYNFKNSFKIDSNFRANYFSSRIYTLLKCKESSSFSISLTVMYILKKIFKVCIFTTCSLVHRLLFCSSVHLQETFYRSSVPIYPSRLVFDYQKLNKI